MNFRLLILAASLAGCASVGRPINPSATVGFVKGVTTEAEVIQRVGRPPDTASLMADGRKMDQWIYTRSKANGKMFIPFVGPFIGGIDTNQQTLQAIVNQQGIVDEMLYNQAAIPSQAH